MDERMAAVYAKLIRAGIRELEDIPEHLRPLVKEMLENATV